MVATRPPFRSNSKCCYDVGGFSENLLPSSRKITGREQLKLQGASRIESFGGRAKGIGTIASRKSPHTT